MPTPAVILSLAPGAAYLAGNAIAKGQLFPSNKVNPILPKQIYAVYFILNKIYTLDPSNAALVPCCNYLWEIMGRWGVKAQSLSGGGGSVAPVTPGTGTLANAIDWIVSGTASGTAPLATGGSAVTFDGTGGMPDLRGYNMDFFRGGIPQYTTNPGDGTTYYSWNRITGVFTISVAANLGEPMRISPIG